MNKKIIFLLLALVLIIGIGLGLKEYGVFEKNPPGPDEELIDDVEFEDEEVKVEVKEDESYYDIKVGEKSADFILKNLEGEDVRLSDYEGKIVLLNFWTTTCPFCIQEMPDMQRLKDENEDLVILAVDVMEDEKKVKDYIDQGGYDFEVLLDEKGEVARTYLISAFPTSYFIDEEGILLGQVPGMMTWQQMNDILENIRGKE